MHERGAISEPGWGNPALPIIRPRPRPHKARTPKKLVLTEKSRLVSPMRELERDLTPNPTPEAPTVIVGRGRVGNTLARALRVAGVAVRLSSSEEATLSSAGATAVLLCVPDEAIAEVCEAVAAADPPPALVGHVSGASTLEALASARASGAATFSLHPLQTFADDRTSLQDIPCAVSGSDPDAEEFAAALAERLQMRYFGVPEE